MNPQHPQAAAQPYPAPQAAAPGPVPPPFAAPPAAQPAQPGPQGPNQGSPYGPQYPPPGAPGPGVPTAGPGLPLLAGFAAVVLVALGLSIPFDSSAAWATQTAWSIFAIVAVLVTLAPALRGTANPRTVWRIGAAGAAGVLAHWVLIVLPSISSNQGLVLTLGAGAAAAGVWFSPLRPR